EGDFQAAIDGFQQMLDATDRAGGRYTRVEARARQNLATNLAITYTLAERYDEAVTVFIGMKDLVDTPDGTLDSYIVDTYRMADETDRALDAAETALAQFPENRQLKLQRADLMA